MTSPFPSFVVFTLKLGFLQTACSLVWFFPFLSACLIIILLTAQHDVSGNNNWGAQAWRVRFYVHLARSWAAFLCCRCCSKFQRLQVPLVSFLSFTCSLVFPKNCFLNITCALPLFGRESTGMVLEPCWWSREWSVEEGRAFWNLIIQL